MTLHVSRRLLATSSHPAAEGFRRVLRSARAFSIPAPRFLVRPALAVVLVLRTVYYFIWRVFLCEPLFKAYCRTYGPNLHTDVYFHWIWGRGDIIVGHDVLFDGKSSITFAARYCDNPTLRVGNHTQISHNVTLVVGREIAIGDHCHIATGVTIFDVHGHPADPGAREQGRAPAPEDVRPVRIGDNVWIGRNAIVHPGVTIGEGSIVSAGAVVLSDLPAMSIAAGNPARKVGVLGGRTKASPRDDENVEAAIAQIVCRIANLARLDPTQDYFDAGLESVQALELLVELESRFGIDLSDDEFVQTRTVRDLGRLVAAGKASG